MTAMLDYRVDIMELLFKAANERKPEHGFTVEGVTSALERAVDMRSIAMTEVLCRKCSTIQPGRALRTAVLQNNLEMVKLLVLQRNLASEVVKVLLDETDARTIQGALTAAVTSDHADVVKVIMARSAVVDITAACELAEVTGEEEIANLLRRSTLPSAQRFLNNEGPSLPIDWFPPVEHEKTLLGSHPPSTRAIQ